VQPLTPRVRAGKPIILLLNLAGGSRAARRLDVVGAGRVARASKGALRAGERLRRAYR
jgi:hypothetical protein